MNDGSIFLKKHFALMLSLFNYTDYYLICLYLSLIHISVGVFTFPQVKLSIHALLSLNDKTIACLLYTS